MDSSLRDELLKKGCGSLERLKEVFAHWLLLPDPHLLEVILAGVVANQLGGDPLWLLVVAPPSSAKTEIIRALSRLPVAYPLSNLTANTLLSGKQGKKDASLLPQLTNKVVMLKDFTTVLTMHRDARAEIFAQLREVYDGSYAKAYGTGEQKSWEGRVGFLAGVTEVIDSQHAVHGVLGERFILYRPETEGRQDIARRALRNAGTESKMRKELGEAMEGFVLSLGKISEKAVSMPDETEGVLVVLADLVAKGRAGVPRDGYERAIDYIPQPETPARLAKQLAQFGKALAIVRAKEVVGPEELGVMRKVALDTMNRNRMAVVVTLQKLKPWQWTETVEVMAETRIPTKRCLELLEDLWVLGIAERDIGDGQEDFETGRRGRKPYKWRLSDEYRYDLRLAGLFGEEPPF